MFTYPTVVSVFTIGSMTVVAKSTVNRTVGHLDKCVTRIASVLGEMLPKLTEQ